MAIWAAAFVTFFFYRFFVVVVVVRKYAFRGLPLITYAPRGRGVGSSLLVLCVSIAYYMQKGGGVQIACKIAYVINGRPLRGDKLQKLNFFFLIWP